MALIYRADFSQAPDGPVEGATIGGRVWTSEGGTSSDEIIEGVLTLSSGVWRVDLPASAFSPAATKVGMRLHVDLSGWRAIHPILMGMPAENRWCGGYVDTFYGSNNYQPYYPWSNQGSSGGGGSHLDSGPVELLIETDLVAATTSFTVNGLAIYTSPAGEGGYDPSEDAQRLSLRGDYNPTLTLLEIYDDTGTVQPPFWTDRVNTYENI